MCDSCGDMLEEDDRHTILIHTGAGLRRETYCSLCYEAFDDGPDDDFGPEYDPAVLEG